jgi:hypothetical protein
MVFVDEAAATLQISTVLRCRTQRRCQRASPRSRVKPASVDFVLSNPQRRFIAACANNVFDGEVGEIIDYALRLPADFLLR